MRSTAKSALEALLLGAGIARLVRAAQRGRTLVLAYHNIVPAGEPARGDLALHLPVAAFARQLDALRRTHDVVPLDEALAPASRARRPRAAITFDDAYRGAVTAGIDELVRRGMPATVFVAPGRLGGHFFWWDRFSEAGGAPTPAFREHALQALQGRDEAVAAWAAETDRRPLTLPAHAASASVDELRSAARHGGIAVASHSWSHPNLAALDGAELEAELVPPLRWLRERFDRVLDWLAYPYGLHSGAAERAAEAAGYRGALRVSGGWLRPGAAPAFALPRLNIDRGISDRGFRLRAAGVLRR